MARSRVQTFGRRTGADWRAHDVVVTATHTTFRPAARRAESRRVRRCRCWAITTCAMRWRPWPSAPTGLDDRGAAPGPRAVPRREATARSCRRRPRASTVYDDFAHHPTAVAETLRGGAARVAGQRIWAVFEPRSASSCRRVFQDDFARAFAGADQVVIASVFRSTLPAESGCPRASSSPICAPRDVAARHLPDVDAIVADVAAEARDGDLVVIMSNGGFGGIHGKLLSAGARGR